MTTTTDRVSELREEIAECNRQLNRPVSSHLVAAYVVRLTKAEAELRRIESLSNQIADAESTATAAYAEGDRTTFAIQSALAHRLRKELEGRS